MAHLHAKLMIVGSGPAGYTAAIYAARALLEPVMVSGFQPGGQLMITTDVENYPGYADVIQGPWLMEQMRLQAEHVGTHMVSDHIVKVELGSRPFRLGGGNTAVEEALYLANLASKVTVVHRRDAFRAERILQERLFKHPNVEVVWDTAIDEICGGAEPPSVTHVRLRNLKTGAVSERKTDGVFVAIGHRPATELFAGQLDMKTGGYLLTQPGPPATDVPGVFAAGDLIDD